MDFANLMNKASRLYNKILMLILGLIIFFLFILSVQNPSNFSLTSSRGITLLTFWIIFSLISLLYTVNGILLNTNFNASVREQKKKGKPVEGIRGFDDFKASLAGARNFSILVTVSSILSLVIFVAAILFDPELIDANTRFKGFLATLAVTFAFLTISVLFLVEYPEETSFSPGGLIGFYEPNSFPMTIDNLLSEVFITYLDPATYLDIDEWSLDIKQRLSPDFEPDENAKTRLERARERILLLLYLNSSNPDIVSDAILYKEMMELVGEKNVDPLVNGDETGLTFNEISRILSRIESMSPEPFRLIDRLMIRLTDDYEEFVQEDVYYTLSAKSNMGSVKESAGILAFFLNNTERDDREVLVELHGGIYEVHPSHQRIKLKLDPLTDPYPKTQPPIISSEGEDILGLLTDLLQVGDAVWFRIKPNGFGYKVITIQAEEKDGFVKGESLELKFSKSVSWYAKTYLPKLSGATGLVMPVLLAFIGL